MNARDEEADASPGGGAPAERSTPGRIQTSKRVAGFDPPVPETGSPFLEKSIPGRKRRRRSRNAGLAWHLMLPIGAIAIPLVALTVFSLWSQYLANRRQAEVRLLDYARSVARLIDREFELGRTVGEMLARSTARARGDLEAFHLELRFASRLMEGRTGDSDILITYRNADGQLIAGQPAQNLVPVFHPPHFARAIETRTWQVSDLFISPSTGNPRIAVAVPVPGPDGTGDPVGMIAVGIPIERFRAIIKEAKLPEGALASIQDRTGVTIARSLNEALTFGKLPMPAVLEAVLHADSGVLPPGTMTLEHVPSTIAFAHAPLTGYIIKIDVPETVFTAPLRATLLRAATIGLAVALGGMALAWLAARRLVQAFHSVPFAAEAGARAGGVPPVSIGVREADDLASRLARALAERDREAASARGLFDDSPVGVALVDLGGTIRAANDAFLRLLGRRRSDTKLWDMSWQDVVPTSSTNEIKAAVAATLAGNRPSATEEEVCRADGICVPVLVSFGRASPDGANAAVFLVDLSDQRVAEAALREIVAQQRLFIEKAPAGIAMFDQKMRFLAVSRRFLQDYRIEAEDPNELSGRSFYEAVPDLTPTCKQIHRQVLAGETIAAQEDEFVRADGTTDWFHWEMTPWLRPGNGIGGALLFAELVTASKVAEQELRRSEARFRQVVRSSPNAMVITDLDGTIEMVNPEAERLFGHDHSALIGRHVELLIPERSRAQHRVHQTRFGGGRLSLPLDPDRQVVGLRKDGVEFPLSIRLTPIESAEPALILCTIIDLTEYKRQQEALLKSEELLRQALKMEAIGKLTGGMAHDFNNLLGIIIGSLDLVHPMLDPDGQLHELVGDALEASLRGAELTRRLLAFARRQPLDPQQVAVNELVETMARLFTRTLGEHISISLRLGPDVWPVVADCAQLETAITNLATNARDAMPSGGTLTVATANRVLDSKYAAAHAEVEPGDYVVIEIADTGCGMSPEIMDHVFDPFFTTKPLGQGTGLGLSMVFGFIKQSGGHVEVDSEPGVGSTFRLYLPRSVGGSREAPVAPAAPLPRATGETVLVVEDNEALRRVVLRQLAELGYRVLEAEHAAAALAVLEREQVAVILTDIMMPGGMNGAALAREALQRWPEVKVVLTSGFPDADIEKSLGEFGESTQLLSKPYRREQLAAALRAALVG